MAATQWQWRCPTCKNNLTLGDNRAHCSNQHQFSCVDGVWRLLSPERAQALDQFMREYETVRESENRGSADSHYYNALPFPDQHPQIPPEWKVRAASYTLLEKKVLATLPNKAKVVDLGAGNGWLSGRLARMGYDPVAVDLMTNALDGLGAYVHYTPTFVPVQAEFNRLPLVPNQADCVIFNASFHYSADYEEAINEANTILKPNGVLAIVDTPVYQKQASGNQMVAERERFFAEKFGFRSNAQQSENFLTPERLKQLEKACDIRWQLHHPHVSIGWSLRPLRAKLRGHREPARFPVIISRKSA